MWLGVLYHETEDNRPPGENGGVQVLLAYQSDRILVASAAAGALADAMVSLRAAATRAGRGSTCLPRCGHCGADLGMPDLDPLVACD